MATETPEDHIPQAPDVKPVFDIAQDDLPWPQDEALPVDDDGNLLPGADPMDDDPNDDGDADEPEHPVLPLDPTPRLP